MKKIGLLIALAALLVISGCAKEKEKENTIVKIGIVGSSRAWKHVKEEAAKENITIEIVEFTDYPQPNAALAAKEIDLNAFQHVIYLNKEKDSQGYDLTVIGKTVIAPLGLYSKNLRSLSEVKDGDKVLIPDDVTNGGRALLLLEANGLIEVNDAAGFMPTLKDITANPKQLEIKEVTATNIPALLPDVAFAAVNSGVAFDAKLMNSEAVLAMEEVNLTSDNPYINVIVARTQDKDNAVYQRIVALYQTDAVKKIIEEDTKGSSVPVW